MTRPLPAYIETVPRRRLRFIAPVVIDPGFPSMGPVVPATVRASARSRWLLAAGVLALSAALHGAGGYEVRAGGSGTVFRRVARAAATRARRWHSGSSFSTSSARVTWKPRSVTSRRRSGSIPTARPPMPASRVITSRPVCSYRQAPGGGASAGDARGDASHPARPPARRSVRRARYATMHEMD